MSKHKAITDRPIRVVLFFGPGLRPDTLEFISRLEAHHDIMFMGGYCRRRPGELRRRWKRRGPLLIPIAVVLGLRRLWRTVSGQSRRLRATTRAVADRIHFAPDLHVRDVLRDVQQLGADLGLIYGAPILKPELFEIPALGTIGIHHGKAPEYRGVKTTFWAMYNAERTAGVTIQKINAGLDTGDIIEQGEVEIGSRSRATVWRELEMVGFDLYVKAILDLKNGVAVMTKQDRGGRVYRNPGVSDLLRFALKQCRRRRLSRP